MFATCFRSARDRREVSRDGFRLDALGDFCLNMLCGLFFSVASLLLVEFGCVPMGSQPRQGFSPSSEESSSVA